MSPLLYQLSYRPGGQLTRSDGRFGAVERWATLAGVDDGPQAFRRLIDLWNAGDIEAYLEAAGPRVRFSPDPMFPERGPFSGEELRTFLEQWQEAWGGESDVVVVDDVFERSGAVLARVRWEVSGAASGAHVPSDWAEFTFVAWFGEDGALDHLLAFFDHDQALAAADAGLEAAG